MPILIKAKLEKAESQKNIDKYGLSAHNINLNYYEELQNRILWTYLHFRLKYGYALIFATNLLDNHHSKDHPRRRRTYGRWRADGQNDPS